MNGSEKQQWEAETAFSLLLVSAVAPANVQVCVLPAFQKYTEVCKGIVVYIQYTLECVHKT